MKSPRTARLHTPSAEREGRGISFVGDDESLVAAIRKRQPAAVAAFYDRYSAYMLKILVRILGNDADLEDVHHEVFMRALSSLDKLRDATRLTPWMVSVAVFCAKTCLQRRYRRKWLTLFAREDLAVLGDARHEPDRDAAAELRCTYQLLDRMPPDERVPFTLRFIESMELAEVAQACGVSLATAKRRLKRAETRFLALREPSSVARGLDRKRRPMEPRLTILGQRLARLQDEGLERAFDFVSARRRLLDSARPVERAKGRWAWGVVLAAVVAAVLLARSGSAPLEFRVGQGPGETGEWVAAPSGEAVPIVFSDGTAITLRQNARARVANVAASGATVVVERGVISASVVHRPDARWQVSVGPFDVRVTGTEFDVGWQPEAELFSLVLRAGSVLVTGPGIRGERAVRAGEKLQVSRASEEGAPVERNEPAADESPSGARPEATASVPEQPSLRHPQRGARKPPAKVEPLEEFRKLAQSGQYGQALDAVESLGFERLCLTAPVADVMLLGDAARLVADVERASLAYHAVLRRFSGREAAQAAFFLGRLAFDQSADYAGAARYFALSIDEAPEGPLAREATGRLMEAKLLLGDTSGAHDAARRYLARYPDGPHGGTAKRLLAGD